MAGPLPADEAGALDAAAGAAFRSAASPGAVVAVRGPRGTWTKAYGVADKATNAPMTTDGYQRIGSVTKTFIGTLLLQLADDGKLSLDDPIDKYVPGVPNGATVTLRSLANMTSGVASYTLDEGWQKTFFGEPFKVWTPDELLRIGLALPPRFPPGSAFDYSNTNTILLGKVIEKQAGQDLATVLRTRILEPLRLTATSFPGPSPVLPDPHPRGYTLQGNTATPDKPVDATDWNPSWGWAAGEMISRVDDLLTYGRAMGTGQGLLPPATQAQRLTSFPGPAGYGCSTTRSASPAPTRPSGSSSVSPRPSATSSCPTRRARPCRHTWIHRSTFSQVLDRTGRAPHTVKCLTNWSGDSRRRS